ncbi:MAG TPA: hypothetical protein VGS07_18560 [Thermoanaerobaculia bacterium]|jgi:hypothetical protein|nr:hypothetical protein [Thermoanaerobaculia bacterium]
MAAQEPRIDGGQVDVAPLLGTWVNSNADTEWIRRFVLARRGAGFVLSAEAAAPPHDWGEVEISTYTDNIGELAFLAIYDRPGLHSVLAANTNKGLVVIAGFHRAKDGSRPGFLCREFYYRE